jgi:hypothetical protein
MCWRPVRWGSSFTPSSLKQTKAATRRRHNTSFTLDATFKASFHQTSVLLCLCFIVLLVHANAVKQSVCQILLYTQVHRFFVILTGKLLTQWKTCAFWRSVRARFACCARRINCPSVIIALRLRRWSNLWSILLMRSFAMSRIFCGLLRIPTPCWWKGRVALLGFHIWQRPRLRWQWHVLLWPNFDSAVALIHPTLRLVRIIRTPRPCHRQTAKQ